MKFVASPSPNSSAYEQSPPPSESPSSSLVVRDEKEKTIPFLRQLTEMLQNNEELISFVPGQRFPHETIHGRIVVHDRNRVQSEVLPVYFNHASFASLRRQLSYFSFVRVGKSRQSGVTYTNDGVVELSDILKLKRRTSSGQAGGAVKKQVQGKRQAQGKRPKKPSLRSPPKQVQQQDQQQQEEQQLATAASADDVASAVRSGTLHAEKTNLDISDGVNNNNEGGPMFAPVPSSAHTSSATQSSISQSNSDSSSSNASHKGSSNSGGLGGPKSKSSKRKFVKHSIPRKERARFDRLLSVNNIVPFIHLPAGHALGRLSVKKEPNVDANSGERAIQKENKPEFCRERASSHGAIDALLALGAVDRQ